MYMSNAQNAQNAQNALDQTIGMEELFLLGGFVEEATRTLIKDKWEAVIPYMATNLGVNKYDGHPYDESKKIICEIVDNYDVSSSEDSLFQLIKESLEEYFLAVAAEEPDYDDDDYDADDFCNNSED